MYYTFTLIAVDWLFYFPYYKFKVLLCALIPYKSVFMSLSFTVNWSVLIVEEQFLHKAWFSLITLVWSWLYEIVSSCFSVLGSFKRAMLFPLIFMKPPSGGSAQLPWSDILQLNCCFCLSTISDYFVKLTSHSLAMFVWHHWHNQSIHNRHQAAPFLRPGRGDKEGKQCESHLCYWIIILYTY